MFHIDEIRHALQKRIFSAEAREVKQLAEKSWTLAPEETRNVPSAIYLDGQLERVRGCQFTDEPPAVQVAQRKRHHGETRCFLVKDVALIDGSLYKANAKTFIAARKKKFPTISIKQEFESAALYCSAIGIQYFGSWLIDDCPTYLLAKEMARPTTVEINPRPHVIQYETMLSMSPTRTSGAFFREVFLFDDFSQNSHKRERFLLLKNAIQNNVGRRAEHPGTFILRRSHGVRRVLKNEVELAAWLKEKRGFKIVDPMRMDALSIAQECAGSTVIIGVEGSALMHGISVLAQGGTVFALQPPSRFVSVYKNLTDRDGQNFAFVVGQAEDKMGDFMISIDEVERTLDLLPKEKNDSD